MRILSKLPSDYQVHYVNLYEGIGTPSQQNFIITLSELQSENQIQLLPPLKGKQEIELNKESILIKLKDYTAKKKGIKRIKREITHDESYSNLRRESNSQNARP